MTYTLIPDVTERLEIPEDGTLSKTLYRDERLRVVGFAFDEGQELTEHTAAVPAVVQVVDGRLRVVVGDETHELDAHAWLRMDAHLPHSVVALEPSRMVLTMLRSSAPDG